MIKFTGNLRQLRQHSRPSMLRRSTMVQNKSCFNSFINVDEVRTPERSPLKQRRRADDSDGGDLSGLRVGVKDNIVIDGGRTTCASRMLKDFKSPFEATCVVQLKEAGARIVGKCNLDEFALGSHNTTSFFGRSVNPLNEELSSGGSSGGSAAAVAAGLCDVSLGTDTGGSVRVPASFCGVYALKPSYGTISRFGQIPYSNSLDTIGIFSRDIDMLRRTFDVLNKHDTRDMTSLPARFREELAERHLPSPDTITVGILEEANVGELTAEVRIAWTQCMREISQFCNISLVSLPSVKAAFSAYRVISSSDFSSNMAKFTGFLYGFDDGDSRYESLSKNRDLAFGKTTKLKILTGLIALTSGFLKDGDYYRKAAKMRSLCVHEHEQVFRQFNEDGSPVLDNDNAVDFILLPTTIRQAPKANILSKTEEQRAGALEDALIYPASLAGLPVATFPVSSKISNSWPPLGMQVVSRFGNDKLILDFLEILKKNGIARSL